MFFLSQWSKQLPWRGKHGTDLLAQFILHLKLLLPSRVSESRISENFLSVMARTTVQVVRICGLIPINAISSCDLEGSFFHFS